jgi:putative ABC transport system permease protein
MRLFGWLATVGQDLRYGARQLRANPGFTLVAVMSLALGVGANTSIFQLVNAVRLRTLPVHNPQELVMIDFAQGSMRSGNFSTRNSRLTYTQWEQIQTHREPFTGMMAWSARRFDLAAGGEARYAEGLYVSGDFFRVLGVTPIIGRTFTADDDTAGCGSPGAVISYAFWQRERGGDPAAIGQPISLGGRPFPILGVTPPSFFGVEVGSRYDVAIPLCADALLAADGKGRRASRRSWWLASIGRLKPGWTVERAAAYLQTVSPRITEASLPPTYRPEDAKRYLANKITATPAGTGISGLRRDSERPLALLLGITGLVLLIACANLANLLLARASVREREIAVRQAIGASRGRLVGQLLSESLLLAFLGTVLGAILAQVLSRGLIAFMSTEGNPVFVEMGPDGMVFAYTAALAVATCLLFGLLPALRATRVAPASVMRASGRGLTAGRERFSLRRALVITQVALSLVLLVGALLFVRSLQRVMAVDAGFRAEGISSVSVDLRRAQFTNERRAVAFRQLTERVQTRPGVVSAAEVAFTPVSGSGWNESVFVQGSTEPAKDSYFNRVGPGYFRTMGTTFVAGRDFDDRDTLTSPKVTVINEEFAKRYFGASNPIGRSIQVKGPAGQADPVYQVIGVVKNTKYYELREDFLPISFLTMSQDDNPGRTGATYVVRTAGPVRDVFNSVKTAVAEVHPQIGIEFRIMSNQIYESLLRDRIMATLSGAFGILATLLATLGLYGVMAYMVARRRNEIGVRMALGADRGSVIRLVLREAGLLLAIGMAVGTGLAIWAGRAAGALLFGLKPYDPVTLTLAIGLLALVALLASYAPAWRASRLDPMNALRDD